MYRKKTYSATHQVTLGAKFSLVSRFAFILDVWVCKVLQNTGRRSRAERRHGLQIPLILFFGILKHGHLVGSQVARIWNMSEIPNQIAGNTAELKTDGVRMSRPIALPIGPMFQEIRQEEDGKLATNKAWCRQGGYLRVAFGCKQCCMVAQLFLIYLLA